MTFRAVGDLALPTLFSANAARAKADMAMLSQEISTGVKSDTGKAVGHGFGQLAHIERGLRLAESYRLSTIEAGLFTQTAQVSLEAVQDSVSDFVPALISAAAAGGGVNAGATSVDAEARFKQAVDALNVTVGGRSLFAGQETETAPLIQPQALLDALRPIAQAATSSADLIAAFDTWFGPGGDFETTAFQGSTTPMAPFVLGDDARANFTVTANDQGLRDTLQVLATVALMEEAGFPAGSGDVESTLDWAAGRGMEVQTGLSALRAEVGAAEARIDTARVQVEANKAALEISRADLIGADPYETATRLEQAQTHLESLYIVTSRISRLKLSDFL